MNLLELIDGDQVRGEIDLTLTAKDLPNSLIKSALKGGLAVDEVLALDPGAAGREQNPQRQHVANAVNLLTAAILAPIVPQIVSEDYGDGGGYKREKVDLEKLAAELRQRAISQIELATKDDEVERPVRRGLPTVFAVGRARRQGVR